MARRKKNGAGLSAFLGSLIGGIAGALTGVPIISYLASTAGGAIGGHMGGQPDREKRGAIGGGVGAAVLGPLGAALGGYLGGRKPDRKQNPRGRARGRRTNPQLGQHVQVHAPGYEGHGATGVVQDLVTVKGHRGAHLALDRPIHGKQYALVGVGDIRPTRTNPSRSDCEEYVQKQIRRQYHEGKVGKGKGKRSRKQAVAVAFSKARKRGCKLPEQNETSRQANMLARGMSR